MGWKSHFILFFLQLINELSHLEFIGMYDAVNTGWHLLPRHLLVILFLMLYRFCLVLLFIY